MVTSAVYIAPLHTDRLILQPCSGQIASLAYGGRRMMESLLNAQFALDWLDDDGRALLGFYAHQVNHDPTVLGWGLWLIMVRDTRLVIGSAGFKGKPDMQGSVEIGYGIAPSHWRQGYTFEAAAALVRWAFMQPGVRRIRAEAYHTNAASIRILEKLGMRYTHRDGKYTKWELDK